MTNRQYVVSIYIMKKINIHKKLLVVLYSTVYCTRIWSSRHFIINIVKVIVNAQ